MYKQQEARLEDLSMPATLVFFETCPRPKFQFCFLAFSVEQ